MHLLFHNILPYLVPSPEGPQITDAPAAEEEPVGFLSP